MFKPLPVLTALTLVALAVLIGLGVWQLERRAEKHALIAQIAARAAAAPAPIELLVATGRYAAYRRATAEGAFVHPAEAYVYAPLSDPTRPGFKVLTPFRLASGGTVLVDRGWVPEALRAPYLRQSGQIDKEIEIAGTLRPSASVNTFTPPPDLDKKIFYARDSAAIAKLLGTTLATPLILEASTGTPGGPEPVASTVDLPDNHLQYALTWFALALVLLIVYLRLHYVRGLLRLPR
jgi:surfeit locus 1 family protein